MSDKRHNNSIFRMYLATDAFIRRHSLSRLEFLVLDAEYGIVRSIAECPDIFDPMTESEMADELDEYIATLPEIFFHGVAVPFKRIDVTLNQ